MKINRNSWHYDFVTQIFDEPKSLCSYFWKMVGVTLFFGLFIAVIISTLLTLVYGNYLLISGFQLSDKRTFDNGVAEATIILDVASFVWGLIYFLKQCVIKLYKLLKQEGSNELEKQESGFWNITKEWIKAKKQKVCPRIEYFYEEKK